MDKEPPKQADLFMEHNPELADKVERTRFKISVLGGNAFEDDARKLGYALTKHYFSIQTGGYKYGAMKGGLEGANAALIQMDGDSGLVAIYKRPGQ